MASFGQYLKDTQAELRHVAWPTQAQTIVYTMLVAAISVGVAAYLGLFDFLFTGAITHIVGSGHANPIQVTQQTATTTPAPVANPSLNLPGASSTRH